MKNKVKIILLAAASVAGLFLYSCSDDPTEGWDGDGSLAVQFVTDRTAVPQTRVNSSGEWETTDSIGICMIRGGETLSAATIAEGADNRKYKPVTQGVTSAIVPYSVYHEIYYPAQGTVDFVAYSPYRRTGTRPGQMGNYLIPVELNDQAGSENFLVSRNATGKDKNSGPVSLEFKRALTKLVLILKAGDGIDESLLRDLTPKFDMPVTGVYELANGDAAPGPSGTITRIAYQSGAEVMTDVVMLPGTGTGRQVRFELPASVGGGSLTWDMPADMTFEAGYRYTYTLTLNRNGITVGDRDIAPWDDTTEIDIPSTEEPASWKEPNCYMVAPGSTIVIPAAKAYDMWRYHPALRDLGADLTGGITVEVLWTDRPNLISFNLNDMGYNTEIHVWPNNSPGNAVIAVKIGGVIRWSWHIWVTPYKNINDPVVWTPGRYETFMGSVYGYQNNHRLEVFMDRDLGARDSVILGNFASSAVKGLYYQWGRKDPFIGNDGWDNNAYTTIYDRTNTPITGSAPDFNYGIPLRTLTEGSPSNVPLSVTEPGKMYVGVDNPWGDGTDALWGHGTTKSPFDPCPKGWRVPPLYADGTSPWEGIDLMRDIDQGFGYFLADATNRYMGFFNMTEQRGPETGRMSSDVTRSNSWRWYASAAPSGDKDQAANVFMSATSIPLVNTRATQARGTAMPVRCMRE